MSTALVPYGKPAAKPKQGARLTYLIWGAVGFAAVIYAIVYAVRHGELF